MTFRSHTPQPSLAIQITGDPRLQALLFQDLEEGDIVVANRGTKTVLGIGRVTGGYYHVENRSEYRHTVDVDWFDTTERTVDFGGGWRSTIMKVRPDQYHALTANASETGDDTRSTGRGAIPNVPDVHREAELLLKRSGQLVFYGPPGTGKTFTARRHAGWLLEGASSAVDSAWAFGSPSDLREILERRSDVFTTDERPAWLLVANPQYWSWDELFAQGSTEFRWGKIARNYEEVAAGDVVYGYEATPTSGGSKSRDWPRASPRRGGLRRSHGFERSTCRRTNLGSASERPRAQPIGAGVMPYARNALPSRAS